ncbi:MAG: SLATT domain-containing protein [Pyrinomonadaceae bacterium]|nr:SLATT domain-containing protein [Pyrinomonadaceae bacterium]
MSNNFPPWNKDKPEESLDLIYDWAVKTTLENIDWYDRKKKPRRLWSQGLRALSIIFAAVGALCPLIDATGIVKTPGDPENNLILAQWGYVFLAVAASVAGFDYYFGHSSGWMRFIVTQISLERSLKEFQYDWVILKTQEGGNSSNTQMFLQRAKDFTLQVENIIKQETDVWVREFQSNITQLEKVLKTEIEARKTGSIKVTIKNCADFEKVEIRLNDNFVKEFVGVSEGVINTVAPGSYELTAIGTKEGNETKDSRVIEVQAGTMAFAEFTLSTD